MGGADSGKGRQRYALDGDFLFFLCKGFKVVFKNRFFLGKEKVLVHRSGILVGFFFFSIFFICTFFVFSGFGGLLSGEKKKLSFCVCREPPFWNKTTWLTTGWGQPPPLKPGSPHQVVFVRGWKWKTGWFPWICSLPTPPKKQNQTGFFVFVGGFFPQG